MADMALTAEERQSAIQTMARRLSDTRTETGATREDYDAAYQAVADWLTANGAALYQSVPADPRSRLTPIEVARVAVDVIRIKIAEVGS